MFKLPSFSKDCKGNLQNGLLKNGANTVTVYKSMENLFPKREQLN